MTAPGGPRLARACLCLGALLAMPLLLKAAEPVPKSVEPADEDLIEFLGSVDSDDAGWREYLARTGTKPPAAKPPPPPPPSSAPGKEVAKDEH